jgi:hypothetical protein
VIVAPRTLSEEQELRVLAFAKRMKRHGVHVDRALIGAYNDARDPAPLKPLGLRARIESAWALVRYKLKGPKT